MPSMATQVSMQFLFMLLTQIKEEGRRIRQALTTRDGKIIRFIAEQISPMDYVHEVHVCNDITS